MITECKLNGWKCDICGHKWRGRLDRIPAKCPKCSALPTAVHGRAPGRPRMPKDAAGNIVSKETVTIQDLEDMRSRIKEQKRGEEAMPLNFRPYLP